MIFYNPDWYLTVKEITQMENHELVVVNRIAINSQITKLNMQPNSIKKKEALKILLEASKKLKQKETKNHRTSWGIIMTVKNIKKAFGNNIYNMSGTSFRKLLK